MNGLVRAAGKGKTPSNGRRGLSPLSIKSLFYAGVEGRLYRKPGGTAEIFQVFVPVNYLHGAKTFLFVPTHKQYSGGYQID